MAQARDEPLALGPSTRRRPRRRQQIGVSVGALGGEVGEIGPEQLARHQIERIIGQEVDPGDHGVLGHHQVEARPRGNDRRVVRQAQGLGRAIGQGREQPRDRLELVDAVVAIRSGHPWRSRPARR